MPYFVTIKRTRGIPYLYVMYSTYVTRPDGSKQKVQRVIRSFGRLEPLLEKDPTFVEKLKQQYPSQRQLKQQQLERLKAERQRLQDEKDQETLGEQSAGRNGRDAEPQDTDELEP